jgi:hypothetical protein
LVDLEYAESNINGSELLLIKLKGRSETPTGPDEINEFYLTPTQVKHHNNPENDISCFIDPTPISTEEMENIQNVQDRRMFNAENQIEIDYFIGNDLVADKSFIETEVSVSDFVAFPSYQQWHDDVNFRPIMRQGVISSDPRYNYSWDSPKNGKLEGDIIAYEAFSYGGASGSPVFALQKGIEPGEGVNFEGYRPVKMIGINAGKLTDSHGGHSGISYMYKSSAIREMVD